MSVSWTVLSTKYVLHPWIKHFMVKLFSPNIQYSNQAMFFTQYWNNFLQLDVEMRKKKGKLQIQHTSSTYYKRQWRPHIFNILLVTSDPFEELKFQRCFTRALNSWKEQEPSISLWVFKLRINWNFNLGIRHFYLEIVSTSYRI